MYEFKHKLLQLGSGLLLSTSLLANPVSFKSYLEEFDEIHSITVSESSHVGYQNFDFKVRQPVNHEDSGDGFFDQRVVVLLQDKDKPVVLGTNGYMMWAPDRRYGLTKLIDGNQVRIEHRYFGESTPKPKNWHQLTVENSAEDIHSILEILKPYFKDKWISTGTSKGGMTATYHRTYYSDDVDGTIANVAPLSRGPLDSRYSVFLANVSTNVCRNRIIQFQRRLLSEKEQSIEMLSAEQQKDQLSFKQMGSLTAVLDAMVTEYYYFFFQYESEQRCLQIPNQENTLAEHYAELTRVVPAFVFGDKEIFDFEAYYYQAVTELGYPGYYLDGIIDLLDTDPTDYGPYVTAWPSEPFNYKAMAEVAKWSSEDSENVIFVYGTTDPWTAGEYPVVHSKEKLTHKFYVPNANHGAKIFKLNTDDKKIAFKMIEKWLGKPLKFDEPPAFLIKKQEIFLEDFELRVPH